MIVHTNFKASGRNEGGGTEFEDGIETDDLFYENFARTRFPAHAGKLLYAHLLWGKHHLYVVFELSLMTNICRSE